MTVKSGYFKRYLNVDMSAGKTSLEPLSDEFITRYIGGRGFWGRN